MVKVTVELDKAPVNEQIAYFESPVFLFPEVKTKFVVDGEVYIVYGIVAYIQSGEQTITVIEEYDPYR